ncbi:MAG: transketolase family protein [Dehalococcoidales bacterium]|nr:MAG: transketolase family protein [Dehalococcoidales bacterium]
MVDIEFTRKIFGETLAEYGAVDSSIVVLTADVSSSVLTNYFTEQFPERSFNTGIAEAGMVDTAVGMALTGMTPFVNTFAALFLRGVEQIRSCVAYPDINVKLIGSYAGLSDFKDGPTHHSIMDVSVMRSMPNMMVIVPSDGTEIRKMIPLIAQHRGPVYLRISRADMVKIFPDDHQPELGRGITVREGKDVTIITNGHILSRSLEAVEILKGKGTDARVVNMHTVKPLDTQLILECARETGAFVTAEEHSIIGGLGSAVAETLGRELPVPVEMVGINDTFAETALDHDSLLDHYGMAVNDIVLAAEKAISRKGK